MEARGQDKNSGLEASRSKDAEKAKEVEAGFQKSLGLGETLRVREMVERQGWGCSGTQRLGTGEGLEKAGRKDKRSLGPGVVGRWWYLLCLRLSPVASGLASPSFQPLLCVPRTSLHEVALTHSFPLLSPEALPPPSLALAPAHLPFCHIHSLVIRLELLERQRPCLIFLWSLGPALGLNTQRGCSARERMTG